MIAGDRWFDSWQGHLLTLEPDGTATDCNPDSVVVPFDTQAHDVRIDPSDSILSLSERLAKYGGGGTACSIPLRAASMAFSKRQFVGCVLVSDNESWGGTGRPA